VRKRGETNFADAPPLWVFDASTEESPRCGGPSHPLGQKESGNRKSGTSQKLGTTSERYSDRDCPQRGYDANGCPRGSPQWKLTSLAIVEEGLGARMNERMNRASERFATLGPTFEGVEVRLGQKSFEEVEKTNGRQESAEQQWKPLGTELAGRERLAAEMNSRKSEIEEVR